METVDELQSDAAHARIIEEASHKAEYGKQQASATLNITCTVCRNPRRLWLSSQFAGLLLRS